MVKSVTQSSKLLTSPQVAEMIGVTEWCLRNWRHQGNKGPRYVKVGDRFIRYRLSDVEAWLKASERTPASV